VKSFVYAFCVIALLVLVTTPMACKPANAYASATADAYTAVSCPVCGLSGTWTGETKVIDAKIWYKMKCVKGHKFLSSTLS